MSINPAQFSAQPIEENYDVTIEILPERPDTLEYLETPVVPNRIVGFYNPLTDRVDLYITDGIGRRYLKIS